MLVASTNHTIYDAAVVALTSFYILYALCTPTINCLQSGGEAQGGATYCALASLALMDRLGSLSAAEMRDLTWWCLAR
jgi:hypothetical protein